MVNRRWLVAVSVLACASCTTDPGVTEDMTPEMDLSAPPDLTGADMTGADMTKPPDMIKPADMTGADMTVVADMVPPADMVVPPDMLGPPVTYGMNCVENVTNCVAGNPALESGFCSSVGRAATGWSHWGQCISQSRAANCASERSDGYTRPWVAHS